MQNKLQLEIHMSSNQHKMNHPIATAPIEAPSPVQSNQQLFNFEHSSYGYGFRNWSAEQYMFNANIQPVLTQAELQKNHEMNQQKQLVEEAKHQLLARFPYYAINLQQQEAQAQRDQSMIPDNIPMPVEAPASQSYEPLPPPPGSID
jgi:hypothetical protein